MLNPLEEIKNVIKRRLNAKEDWIIYGDDAVKYGFSGLELDVIQLKMVMNYGKFELKNHL